MFSDCQKKFTMQDLCNYLKANEKFPQHMNRPILLCQEDTNAEKMFLSLVGENTSYMQLVFKPESYFINDK